MNIHVWMVNLSYFRQKETPWAPLTCPDVIKMDVSAWHLLNRKLTWLERQFPKRFGDHGFMLRSAHFKKIF